MQEEEWWAGELEDLVEMSEEEHQREGSCEKRWDVKSIGFWSMRKHFKAR